MVTQSEFNEFLKCLDSHDPLGVLVPKNLDVVSGKWSCEDTKYLPILLNMLEDTLKFTGTAFEREKNSEQRFFCLDAICKIDLYPQSVPKAISDCLDQSEDAIRRMALKYVSNAAIIDERTRIKINEIVTDGRAYVGTRIRAYLTRCRIKQRPVTV